MALPVDQAWRDRAWARVQQWDARANADVRIRIRMSEYACEDTIAPLFYTRFLLAHNEPRFQLRDRGDFAYHLARTIAGPVDFHMTLADLEYTPTCDLQIAQTYLETHPEFYQMAPRERAYAEMRISAELHRRAVEVYTQSIEAAARDQVHAFAAYTQSGVATVLDARLPRVLHQLVDSFVSPLLSPRIWPPALLAAKHRPIA